MEFTAGLVEVTLCPRPGYVSKVLFMAVMWYHFYFFHPLPFESGENKRLYMIGPVRALKFHMDLSSHWSKSHQLLIRFGAGRRGLRIKT